MHISIEYADDLEGCLFENALEIVISISRPSLEKKAKKTTRFPLHCTLLILLINNALVKRSVWRLTRYPQARTHTHGHYMRHTLLFTATGYSLETWPRKRWQFEMLDFGSFCLQTQWHLKAGHKVNKSKLLLEILASTFRGITFRETLVPRNKTNKSRNRPSANRLWIIGTSTPTVLN